MTTKTIRKTFVPKEPLPPKLSEWDFIAEELLFLRDCEPEADEGYNGPDWTKKLDQATKVLEHLRLAGKPAPLNVCLYDGHFVQAEWALPNGVSLYVDFDTEIDVTLTYRDRNPQWQTVNFKWLLDFLPGTQE